MSLSHHSGSVRIALVGLLVVAAISVTAGSGRKPAKEQKTEVTSRKLSGSEVMAILQRFPEMVPSYLASSKNDTHDLADIYGFVEVTIAPPGTIFPAARFYRGHNFNSPPLSLPKWRLKVTSATRCPMASTDCSWTTV